MRAGKLKERIIIQEPVRTRRTTGEELLWWSVKDTVFSEWRGLSTSERFQIAQFRAGDVSVFSIRYRTGITNEMRLLVRERAYAIVSVVDDRYKHRELLLYVLADAAAYPLFRYSSIAITQLTPTSFQFVWSTDAHATDNLRYREVGAPSWTTLIESLGRSLAHSRSVAGLVPTKTYEVQVYGVNAGGKGPGWSSSTEFYVPALHFEYSAIEVSGSVPTYSFAWITTAAATTRARYREVGTGTWTYTVEDPVLVTNHSASGSGFVAGKTYEVQVYGENADDWTPGWSSSKEWATPAPPSFVISGVSFTVTRNTITSIFTTSEAAGCIVMGGLYDPEEPPGVLASWYTNLTVHGTAHSHQKTGLVENTVYAINIRARNAGGVYAYAPSISGWYLVQTANALGVGGGLIGIQY